MARIGKNLQGLARIGKNLQEIARNGKYWQEFARNYKNRKKSQEWRKTDKNGKNGEDCRRMEKNGDKVTEENFKFYVKKKYKMNRYFFRWYPHESQFIADLEVNTFLKSDNFCRSSAPLKKKVVIGTPCRTYNQHQGLSLI